MFSLRIQARLIGVMAFGIAVGVILTLVITHYKSITSPQMDTIGSAPATPQVLYWYDPMEPAQHFDKPGKSPFMDMELVPKYAENIGSAGISVDPAMVQNLGMRKTRVKRLPLQASQYFPATLRFNERNQAVIQLRAGGFVEKAWPLASGDYIAAGQPIATFYVAEWLDTQNELLASKAINSPRLSDTLRTRLRLMGMPDTLIQKVEASRKPETRVTISAPINGVIQALDIKTGMSLASGQTLARITSTDSLWLDIAIPEAQASGLHAGDEAIFYAVGAAVVAGKIESLLPALNDSTRTVTARILLPNPSGLLKPGTSGRVSLKARSEDDVLVVPTEALIHTGKRTLVMVSDSTNHFYPVAVTIGAEMDDRTVITAGLSEGDEVVISGQFLLDSEASLMGIEPKSAMEMQP